MNLRILNLFFVFHLMVPFNQIQARSFCIDAVEKLANKTLQRLGIDYIVGAASRSSKFPSENSAEINRLEEIFLKSLPKHEAKLIIDSHHAYRSNPTLRGSEIAKKVDATQFLQSVINFMPLIEAEISAMEAILKSGDKKIPYYRSHLRSAVNDLREALELANKFKKLGSISYYDFFQIGALFSRALQGWEPVSGPFAETIWPGYSFIKDRTDELLDKYFPFEAPIFSIDEVPVTQFNGAWGLGYRVLGFLRTGITAEVDSQTLGTEFNGHDWGHLFSARSKGYENLVAKFKRDYGSFIAYAGSYFQTYQKFLKLLDSTDDQQKKDLLIVGWFILEHEHYNNMTNGKSLINAIETAGFAEPRGLSNVLFKRGTHEKDFASIIDRSKPLSLETCSQVEELLRRFFSGLIN